MSRVIFLIAFVFLTLMVSCQEAKVQKEGQPVEEEQKDLIEQNRDFLKKERESIEAFISINNFEMKRTGSGMYYMQLEQPKDESTELMEEGDEIEYAFRISLLDGTPIANSKDKGNRTIFVGKDQVELGLHEAFAMMELGGKYLFIFPSHLAHGLASNEDDVPPRATLIYELEPLKKLN